MDATTVARLTELRRGALGDVGDASPFGDEARDDAERDYELRGDEARDDGVRRDRSRDGDRDCGDGDRVNHSRDDYCND